MPAFSTPRVHEMLQADAYATGLGVELISVADDEIVVGMTVGAEHLNFLEVGHGGMVFSLADCVFSLASNSAGERAVAIDTHLVLTAPTRLGDHLQATVKEASRGRSLGTYQVTVTRDDGRTVGLFTGTVFITPSG